MNRDFVIGGYRSVNDFYEFLGIEPISGGDEIGWNISSGLVWIDFDHYKTVLDDGLEVCVIDMDWLPETYAE